MRPDQEYTFVVSVNGMPAPFDPMRVTGKTAWTW